MGTLRVVATPIGNLEDVTLRAVRVLREAERIFVEDTRRTRILLDHFDITPSCKPVSLHAHNEAARIAGALEALRDDLRVVLVSDAGTPLLSDPGARLVEAALDAGHRVEAVPGASAVLAALVSAGLPAQPFTFLGFLPRKAGERRRLLEGLAGREETLVLFESPKRLGGTLSDLSTVFGPDRRACVARELTKLHEEAVRGGLAELAERFAEGARGEVTLVVAGASDTAVELADDASVDARILELAARGLGSREIAAQVAAASGRPRRQVYARTVELRGRSAGDASADPPGAPSRTPSDERGRA